MSVTTPNDAQLAKIANNDKYLVVALRNLFKQAGTLTPKELEVALIYAETALAASNQNKAVIENVKLLAEMKALEPIGIKDKIDELVALEPKEEVKKENDLTPIKEIPHIDTNALQMVALAPV